MITNPDWCELVLLTKYGNFYKEALVPVAVYSKNWSTYALVIKLVWSREAEIGVNFTKF